MKRRDVLFAAVGLAVAPFASSSQARPSNLFAGTGSIFVDERKLEWAFGPPPPVLYNYKREWELAYPKYNGDISQVFCDEVLIFDAEGIHGQDYVLGLA